MASIINLDDVKSMLWDPPATPPAAFDTILSDLIEDVIIEIESSPLFEFKLNAVANEIIYADARDKHIYLPHLNISNVSVWMDLLREFTPGELIDPERYAVNAERGILEYYRPTYLWGVSNINSWDQTSKTGTLKIEYDGGYTAATLRRDIKRAIIKQVAYSFRRRKDLGLTSVSYPQGSVNKFSTSQFLPEVESVLKGYRRISL